ncbi:MAG: hypothetical protein IT453_19635 [Planctomycetes bacterium]|nr:hypothetical protein [Planctomycetota bacterium]
MKNLRAVGSFGGIDADTDALLDDCFQDHEAYAAAIKHERPLVLGRKGSGKTAIYRRIVGIHSHNAFALGHTFLEYPWHHHRLQELVGVPEESRYIQSWQYLILLGLARLLINDDQSQPWSTFALEEIQTLEQFVTDSYGTKRPELGALFTPERRLRIEPHFRFGTELIGGGLNLERLPVSDLPKVVQEVNRRVRNAVLGCLNPDIDYYVCFDELDRGFSPSDSSYHHMLTGLLLAAKLMNDEAARVGKRLSVIVFLRDDIYQVLRFEDKNKITEARASVIEWDSPRTQWTLRQLMERRFSALLGEGVAVNWSDVFDESKEMSGRQRKYKHILDRTFRRPRDIIKMCNEVLLAYKADEHCDSELFLNGHVIAARRGYSEYLLRELVDEVQKHMPRHDKYFEILRSVGSGAFTREQFDSVCSLRAALLGDGDTAESILRGFFDFSIIGYQKTGGAGGGSTFVWRYLEAGARFDETASTLRVHPGLVEALGLKKWEHRDDVDDTEGT